MRWLLIPLALLSASLPSLAHDRGYWHRPVPRVVRFERPWRAERCEPRIYVRRGWYACPPPSWVERREYCEDERPVVRFQFNLR
jgi:hypothetical protein